MTSSSPQSGPVRLSTVQKLRGLGTSIVKREPCLTPLARFFACILRWYVILSSSSVWNPSKFSRIYHKFHYLQVTVTLVRYLWSSLWCSNCQCLFFFGCYNSAWYIGSGQYIYYTHIQVRWNGNVRTCVYCASIRHDPIMLVLCTD